MRTFPVTLVNIIELIQLFSFSFIVNVFSFYFFENTYWTLLPFSVKHFVVCCGTNELENRIIEKTEWSILSICGNKCNGEVST